MRAGSVAKTLIGWFLLPVAMGAVAFYVMKPMFEADADPMAKTEVQGDGTKVASKKFAAPSVKIFSSKSRGMRRGGSLIGKRGRKKKVEAPKTDVAGPPGPPTVSGPPSGGGPPDTGGAAGPSSGGTTPVSGGTF